MKLKAIMNRAASKQGTDLLGILRLCFDTETRTAALSQIATVDLWLVRQRQRSLQWIQAAGGADITPGLAADLLHNAAARTSAR